MAVRLGTRSALEVGLQLHGCMSINVHCCASGRMFYSFSSAVSTASSSFLASVVRCVLRLDTRTRVIWPFEHTVVDVPLVADFYHSRYAHKPLRVRFYSVACLL